MRRTLVYGTATALLATALVLTLIGWGDDASKLPDWQALVLGLVQGFTELLPISSSGHLILVPWLGDWTYLKEHEAFNKTFDVALHLGTLVAVVAYFWHDLIGYAVAWCRSVRAARSRARTRRSAGSSSSRRSLPRIIGAAFQSVIEDRLGEPWQIAILIAVFALVLCWADRRPERRDIGELGLGQGLLVGLAQSLALAPGVSRSGITITRRPVSRADAGRRRAALVPPARPDRARRRPPQGVHRRDQGRVAVRVGGTVRRRHDHVGRQGLLAINWLLGYVRATTTRCSSSTGSSWRR